jgi:hypothetical protein
MVLYGRPVTRNSYGELCPEVTDVSVSLYLRKSCAVSVQMTVYWIEYWVQYIDTILRYTIR